VEINKHYRWQLEEAKKCPDKELYGMRISIQRNIQNLYGFIAQEHGADAKKIMNAEKVHEREINWIDKLMVKKGVHVTHSDIQKLLTK